jgi:ABC-type nitrate/sulfonate/bicarbonate transport system ATPase subunit
MIWRNLLRRRVRTALTVLGISVGLGLIVGLVSIADGYVESFGSMATGSGSDLTVMQADVADMSFSALDEDVGKKITAISGVSQVAGTLFSAVPMPGTPYGLADHADRFPSELSGGEAQRVAVARALANAPPLILADEPTGNLDSQSGAEVLDLLQEMNAEFGMTLIMVTHDPVVALSTRRILTLRDGRIEQDEPVEAVYLHEMQQISHTRLGQLLFGERAEVLSVPERDEIPLRAQLPADAEQRRLFVGLESR